ncbi:hypothetical protein BDV95DRAFT_22113 [Massariosphaeria phaeospora]|uniref:Uncharacterized protein n=1 Tax=Massariosphaeria phaeospora TaxID=100035 RepID=A0A7C8IFM4_9PLEO|nr:hypothetical protein BDV95DRAFT_22113 [Massariosphaeria phaeospora]
MNGRPTFTAIFTDGLQPGVPPKTSIAWREMEKRQLLSVCVCLYVCGLLVVGQNGFERLREEDAAGAAAHVADAVRVAYRSTMLSQRFVAMPMREMRARCAKEKKKCVGPTRWSKKGMGQCKYTDRAGRRQVKNGRTTCRTQARNKDAAKSAKTEHGCGEKKWEGWRGRKRADLCAVAAANKKRRGWNRNSRLCDTACKQSAARQVLQPHNLCAPGIDQDCCRSLGLALAGCPTLGDVIAQRENESSDAVARVVFRSG